MHDNTHTPARSGHSGARAAYSPAEFCELLGIARSTLYLELAANRIASVRIGTRRLIPATELVRLLKGAA